MSVRLFVELSLHAGAELALPPAAARHAQVRRVQPGDLLMLFDGTGSDWPATVLAMGRSEVCVRLDAPQAVHLELPLAITLALGMPANERMDTVIEKATELGVAGIQTLHTERSVLRLQGERAQRKQAHWLGIAQAACEQSGRACVPQVPPVLALPDWLSKVGRTAPPLGLRLVLSLRADAVALPALVALVALPAAAPKGPGSSPVVFLSGPEGGLTTDEEDAARAQGFVPVNLGPRVLRADTAPLAALAWLGLHAGATLYGPKAG
jgi:16S rRNA (uracil1498-N3)-methyltransferase